VDVYDVAPTILAVKKLPLARDMPGRVIAEAFEEGVLDRPSQVKSYTEMPEAPSVAGIHLQLPM
jgi:hypothetical protein